MAQENHEIAGCVGPLRHTASTAEVKRLYVRPAFRGLQLGYKRLILDAAPQTTVAQQLYRTIGFQEIAPYYANPVPGTKFFALSFSAVKCEVSWQAITFESGQMFLAEAGVPRAVLPGSHGTLVIIDL